MQVLTSVEEARIRELLGREEFFWVDLARPSDEELTRLGELLRLHPVAMEDSHEFRQRPKLDVYGDHLLLVFYTARVTGADEPLAEPLEVHVYISGQFVATIRRESCVALDDLHELLVPEDAREEEFLVYRILDALTDAFYPVIDVLEHDVDRLEGEVLHRPRREHLGRIYRLKQEVHDLQRLVSAQRDQFGPALDAILNLAGLA